jgi:hypothetical protein
MIATPQLEYFGFIPILFRVSSSLPAGWATLTRGHEAVFDSRHSGEAIQAIFTGYHIRLRGSETGVAAFDHTIDLMDRSAYLIDTDRI